MKHYRFFTLLFGVLFMLALSAQSIKKVTPVKKFYRQDYEIPAYSNKYFMVDKLSDNSFKITPFEHMRYMLLPVNDASPEGVLMLEDYEKDIVSAKVHLTNSDDFYYIPVDLDKYNDCKEFKIKLSSVSENDVFWNHLKMADDLSEVKQAGYVLHHSAGNALNGRPLSLFFKDGQYHLVYQTNLYGHTSENIAVAHSVSSDLFEWSSGRLLLPYNNKEDVVSGMDFFDSRKMMRLFYSVSDGANDVASFFARSTQNADSLFDVERLSFSKTEPGFRISKMWRNAERNEFVLLGADREKVCLYTSDNFIDWNFISSFDNPLFASATIDYVDIVQIPVLNSDVKKHVMIVSLKRTDNVASTVYYMTGDFDGTQFVPSPQTDFMKFNEGVSLSALTVLRGAGDGKCVAVGWLDNSIDKKMYGLSSFESVNTLPLNLFLYERQGKYLLGAEPLAFPDNLKADKKEWYGFKSKKIKNELVISDFNGVSASAFDVSFTIEKADAPKLVFRMYNDKNEFVFLNFDLQRNQLVVDRIKSGEKNMGSFLLPDEPVVFEDGKSVDVRVVVDGEIMEIFINGGRVVASYGINPSDAYKTAAFSVNEGKCTVKNFLSIPFLQK